jgi:hypothetical protein
MSLRGVVATLLLALCVFAVVQDRMTAAAARRYVAMQREAIRTGALPASIDAVMAPGNRRAVRVAGTWAGAVAAAGLGWMVIRSRRRTR